MTADSELLQRFARERADEAFAEVVRRHVNLVYAAALRQVNGDTHLAEDVTQVVFADLARKAGRVAESGTVAAWLLVGARFAAAKAVRGERRRRVREQEAESMNTPADGETAGILWERARPVLDVALGELKAAEREAVLLRFFEGRAFAEIGAQLRLTENAARMRVERALDKLHGLLARRGVSSTTAALALALEQQAAVAAPAGLAASVTSGALAAGAAGTAVATVSLMSMTKLQVGVAAAVLAAGTAGLIWQHRSNAHLAAEVARLQARQSEPMPASGEDRRRGAAEREVAALRAENAALRRTQPASAGRAASAEKNGPGGEKLAPGLVPVTTLGNAGRGTPRAAFATQLWAARNGDVELEASLLAFSPEARARLAALLASLPESVRSQYDTPEKLMAFALAGSPHPVGGMQVLGETPVDDSDMVLRTEWQHADDTIVHQSDALFRRDDGGWRWVVPDVLVYRAAAYLGRTQVVPPGTGGN